MEPEAITPKTAQERAPITYGQFEHASQPPSLEQAPLNGAERHEQTAEASAAAVNNIGMVNIAFPTPTIAQDDTAQSSDSTAIGTPMLASDDDLIEKEWVDRAKKIVEDTRSDPYNQEKAVSALQRDYLKKRYGRELGGA